MALSRQTAYGQIADALRAAILAGEYEPTADDRTRNELPGAAELGTQYGVSDKTAARAVQQLITEGLVIGRPGLRPVVVPRAQRPDRWPMNRRYARAREAAGLVFGADMQGREVVKRISHTGWTGAPDPVAALLRMDKGGRVWARVRQLLIDGRVAELSTSYFPAAVAEGTILTTAGEFPPAGWCGPWRRQVTACCGPTTRPAPASPSTRSWLCLVPTLPCNRSTAGWFSRSSTAPLVLATSRLRSW